MGASARIRWRGLALLLVVGAVGACSGATQGTGGGAGAADASAGSGASAASGGTGASAASGGSAASAASGGTGGASGGAPSGGTGGGTATAGAAGFDAGSAGSGASAPDAAADVSAGGTGNDAGPDSGGDAAACPFTPPNNWDCYQCMEEQCCGALTACAANQDCFNCITDLSNELCGPQFQPNLSAARSCALGICKPYCYPDSWCSPPPQPPSGGSCVPVGAACNPVLGTGCPAGQKCDSFGASFLCSSAGAGNVCASCGPGGPDCQPGYECMDYTCAKYCCTDADCGGKGACETFGWNPPIGLCVDRTNAPPL